jgi:hypothetical protein
MLKILNEAIITENILSKTLYYEYFPNEKI